MKYSTALRDEVRSRIELVERADLVVGIPCYNNQATIGHVVKQVSQGLHQYYRDRKCVIVVSDGGSVDDSREEARAVEVSPFQEIIVTIYRGVRGRGLRPEKHQRAVDKKSSEPHPLQRLPVRGPPLQAF